MDDLLTLAARLKTANDGMEDILLKTTYSKLMETQTVAAPDVDVTFDAKTQLTTILVTNAPEGSAYSISASIGEGLKRDPEQMRTFIHDFTFGFLSNETDEPFTRYFPKIGDGFDKLTPDRILRVDNQTVVFEFGTTREPRQLKQTYEIKMDKYYEGLNNRVAQRRREITGEEYWLAPIVVSHHEIAIGVEMSPGNAFVNEICARFRFAVSVFNTAVGQGLLTGATPAQQENIGIEMMLSQMKTRWEGLDGTGREMSADNVKADDVTEESAALYGSLLYNTAIISGYKKMVEPHLTPNEVDIAIDDFLSGLPGTRLDPKSIIQLPGSMGGPPCKLEDVGQSLRTEPMAEVWDAVITKLKMGEVDLSERSLEEELRVAQQDNADEQVKDMKKLRTEYHRVSLDLTEETLRDLAKVGVGGKKFKLDGEVRAYRESKKEGFAHNVAFDDLEDFLRKELGTEVTRPPQSIWTAQQLVREALDAQVEDSGKYLSFIQAWLVTKTHCYFDGISQIGTELCISLKQHTMSNCFVLKQVPGTGLWMILKPTNSSSHIFVSFLCKEIGDIVIPEGVSKPWLDMGTYFCTEFVSFNTSKLVNLVKSGPQSIAMIAQWVRHYEMDSVMLDKDKSPEDMLRMVCKHKGLSTMFKLSMLVTLEDKHRTEEIMSLFRYISMEKFASVCPNPIKMIEKLPVVLRSRFQVYLMHIMLSAMKQPQYKYVKMPGPDDEMESEESTGGLEEELFREHASGSWEGLINPYTEEIIDNPRRLIELYYLGYAKNKDEVPSANTEFELVRKIIKYEDVLDDANPSRFGSSDIPIQVPQHVYEDLQAADDPLVESLTPGESYDPQDVKFHEWSKRAVLAAADNLKKFFKRLYGANWQLELDNQIQGRFRRISWEQIATLKASSLYDPTKGKMIDKGKVRNKRVKVIEALMAHPDYLGKKPWQVLDEVIDWVDSDGGLRVDIFKKNQHGGLREIYVLELRSRLVQLFVEELSRAICLSLPIEVMMHPENKISKPQEHVTRAAKKTAKHRASVDSSNDAKVWNQGHHVNKFAQFLCRFLPKKYEAFIINCLKQWRHKRIALPDAVINLLTVAPDVTLFEEVDASLAAAYLGTDKKRWIKPGKHHLDIESGMMQGILHYTSSLFHAAMLMYRDNLFHAWCRKRGFQAQTTDVVSSDDSARMTDCFSNDSDALRQTLLFCRADHLGIGTFSKYYGIWMSPKSTMCSENVLEFNSEFFFRASLARPTIKWAYAALNMVEVESLYERQEVFYNLCAQLLEGGAGFWQAFMTQIAQAHLHYKLLGSAVNKLWFMHVNSLIETHDPSLGFFLMDHPLSTGLFGLNYNFWVVVKQSRSLQGRLKTQLENGELTTTTSGSLTGNVQIRFGNRQKVYRLIEQSTQQLPDWKEFINQHPYVLYKVPKTREEVTARLLTKLTSPSVTTSLSKGNELSRLIAASVYIISRAANTVGSAWMSTLGHLSDEAGADWLKLRKVSLLKLALKAPTPANLDDREEEVLFPNRSQYLSIRQTLHSIETLVAVRGGSKKSLRSHIPVFTQMMTLPFSLERMVRYKWFDETPGASISYLERVWLKYLTMIPWLRNSIEETLAASPYEDHIQLRNFIARQGQKMRVIHLTGSPVKTSDNRDMVSLALVRNQFPGVVLLRSGQTEVLKTKSAGLSGTLHGVACIMHYPWKDEVKEEEVSSWLSSRPLVWTGGEKRVANRLMSLSVIGAFCRTQRWEEVDEERWAFFVDLAQRSRLGVIGGFSKIQKKTDAGWKGPGSWIGTIGSVSVQINLMDSEVTEVICSSISGLREEAGLLKQLLRDIDSAPVASPKLFGDTRHWLGPSGDITLDRLGAPVYEQASFSHKFELLPGHVRLSVSDNKISLLHVLQKRKTVLTSFYSSTADFKFSETIRLQGSDLFQKWCKNQPLDAAKAESWLHSIAHKKLSKNSKIDQSRLQEFARVLLLSTLQTLGWSVGDQELRHLIGTDDSFELNDEALEMIDNLNFLADADIDVIMGGGSPPSEPGSTTSQDEQDLLDILAVDALTMDDLIDFKFVETSRSYGDIRRVHRLLYQVVGQWGRDIGSRGRKILMMKKYTPALKVQAEIFERILEWDMTPVNDLQAEDMSDDEDLADFV